MSHADHIQETAQSVRNEDTQTYALPQDYRSPTGLLHDNAYASDNESNERPVREKLKKTSIASIPKNDKVPNISAFEEPQSPNLHTMQEKSENDPGGGHFTDQRGRVLRKRSFEDLQESEHSRGDTNIGMTENDAGHARKRSRDVGAHPVTDPEQQSESRGELDNTQIYPSTLSQKPGAHVVTLEGTQVSTDTESRHSALNLKKKRSRENYDVEMHREQKIAATKEPKAYWDSEEKEKSDRLPGTHIPSEHMYDPPNENFQEGNSSMIREQEISNNTNNSTNIPEVSSPSPFFNLSREGEVHQAPSKPTDAQHQQTQTGLSAFEKTSFGLMSSSSASPFSRIGSSSVSQSSTMHGFGTKVPKKNEGGPELLQSNTASSAFSSNTVAPSTSTGFASSKPGGFGGSFGSGFISSFASAPKLKTFAAPSGDTALGETTDSTKAFGAPAHETDEEDSVSGGEEEGDDSKEEKDGEMDGRFQQQDVATGEDGEKSVFVAPRTQLYFYSAEVWRERGKGTFKLNVTATEPTDDSKGLKNGRFIMRAHQTFRVLLNQPVFKQMRVGDSRGNEPQGKSLSFAVIEEGRLIPYLLKMGDETECKTLYREVRKLQDSLVNQT